VGIAVFPDDGHTVTQLISNADLAMYQAKHAGKNRYAFYSREIAEQSRRLVNVEEQLNKMDPDEELRLVYMPIVDRNKQCVCCEVLLRWDSPVLGNVSPVEFMPIAESSGQFVKIDYWVIDKAISTLSQIRKNLGEDVKLSINISSAQLGSEQVTRYLNEILKKYNVSGSDIEIEITETYNLEQIENTLDRLDIFLDQEFSIVIDDFGVGNTSLMQLIDCPIDKIKLDRDFVDRVTRTHKEELIKAFIKLCHIQNIEVTAEGIETEQQYQLLLDAECDYLQGYYFSRPKPLSDLAICVND
jgi:EAL domain-containing protein (putative c-di-GMP-specific phosphodiesterase class I)